MNSRTLASAPSVLACLLLFAVSAEARGESDSGFQFKGLGPGVDVTSYIQDGLLVCRRPYEGARSAVCGTTEKLGESSFKSLVGQGVVALLIQALDNKVVRLVVIPEFYARHSPEKAWNTIEALTQKFGEPTVLDRGTFTSHSYATGVYEISDDNQTKLNPRLWRKGGQSMVYGEAMPSRRDIYKATKWESFTFYAHDDVYPGELGFDDIAGQTSRMCLIITDDQLYKDSVSIHYDEFQNRQEYLRKKKEAAAVSDI